MQRKDLQVGGTYVRNASKDMFKYGARYSYGSSKVQVVSTDLYIEVGFNSVPESELRRDAEYVEAHLAWALTQAFERETTPAEAQECRGELSQAARAARERYFEADEMNGFRKVEKKTAWNDAGVLVRDVNVDTGELGRLRLCPTRELKMTWYAFVEERDRRIKNENEVAQVRAEQQKETERKRNALRTLARECSELGLPMPYIGDYSTKFELYLDDAITLLQYVLDQDSKLSNLSVEV